MDGRYFEEFVAEIYNLKGYSYELTNNTGDQGLDIILYKDDEKVGVQCKRFTGKVGNKAVQEAFAGKYFYECDKAVVVTPSTFTKSARDLASKLQVTLVDKNELDSILSNLQEYLLNNFFKHEKITEILINSSIDISMAT
ncbi:TPA: restriction endonuclease [Streptococcus pyogenes]|nr:restriction endonuclease [Streptococcus pyogenes]